MTALRDLLASLNPALLTPEAGAAVFGLLLLVLTYALLLRFSARRRRARLSDPPDLTARLDRTAAAAAADPAALISALARVALEARPLLDREDLRLAPFVERAVRDFGRGHRLAPQVDLSLFLHPLHGSASIDTRKRAAAALAGRRLPFAVIDRHARLTAAILRGEPADPTLRQVLRAAEVEVIDLPADWTPEQVKARLREVFAAEAAAEAQPLLAAFTGRKPKP